MLKVKLPDLPKSEATFPPIPELGDKVIVTRSDMRQLEAIFNVAPDPVLYWFERSKLDLRGMNKGMWNTHFKFSPETDDIKYKWMDYHELGALLVELGLSIKGFSETHKKQNKLDGQLRGYYTYPASDLTRKFVLSMHRDSALFSYARAHPIFSRIIKLDQKTCL